MSESDTDFELEIILWDEVDRDDYHTCPEDDILDYTSTKSIIIPIQRQCVDDVYKALNGHSVGSLSEELLEIVDSLKRFLKEIDGETDHIAVFRNNLYEAHDAIHIVVYCDQIIHSDDGLIRIDQLKQYQRLLVAARNYNQELFQIETIDTKSRFRSLLVSMLKDSEMFVNGLIRAWAFHGWSQ